MIHFILWRWVQPNFRELYNYKHVNMMSKMIRSHVTMEHRVLNITDDTYGVDEPTKTFPLWKDFENIPNATGRHLPSCYRRLKLFDWKTQQELGIKEGDRIISLDLDSIIVGSLDKTLENLQASSAVFAGWGVRGTYHEMVFNGSFWTFRAGPHLQHIWSDFDPLVSPRLTLSKGFLGSDQSWLSMNFAKRSDIYALRYPEFASYPREIRRLGKVDARTKIVFFHGSRKPWHPIERRQSSWIANHWLPENPHERLP